MSLLNDATLVANVTAGTTNPLVTKLNAKNNQWFDADSPIQACSVDLHIGKIFIPESSGKSEGSQDNPLELHALGAGHTAIVSTFEELNLPSDIAAVGFPPSRVSVQGLLMTNPGHVDPGYSGPMRFAVINMGRRDFVLRQGDPIVTLLFLKLPQKVQNDWSARNGGKPGRAPNQRDLDLLSADFLDVEARAQSVAKNEVESAGLKLKHREILAGILGTVLSAAFIAFFFWFSGLQELKTKVAGLEQSLSVTKVQQQIIDVDKKVQDQITDVDKKTQQQIIDVDRRLKAIEPKPVTSAQHKASKQ
jgi:dCTP deaminase